jgi:HD-like signal output (HDOD) protein
VGRLALAAALKDEYASSIAGFDPKADPDRLRWERGVFGADHASVGMWLAERWKFSNELVEVIAYHHRPDRALAHVRLVSCVCLGESMLEPGEPAVPEVDSTEPDERWASLLGVDAEMLEILKGELPAKLRAAGAMTGF